MPLWIDCQVAPPSDGPPRQVRRAGVKSPAVRRVECQRNHGPQFRISRRRNQLPARAPVAGLVNTGARAGRHYIRIRRRKCERPDGDSFGGRKQCPGSAGIGCAVNSRSLRNVSFQAHVPDGAGSRIDLKRMQHARRLLRKRNIAPRCPAVGRFKQNAGTRRREDQATRARHGSDYLGAAAIGTHGPP